MDDTAIDDRAATSRLTQREKQVLRAWLEHKTAKQIAIDFGISHHAVEKRLKMARTKLGVATSLEAARMLAKEEGYGQSVAHAPDRSSGKLDWHKRGVVPLVLGGIAMSLTVAALIALGSQTPSSADAPPVPRPDEIVLLAPQPFEQLDKDGSGFLEGDETPVVLRVRGDPEYGPDGKGGRSLVGDYIEISPYPNPERFYADADADGDGKISPDEYRSWSKPVLASQPGQAGTRGGGDSSDDESSDGKGGSAQPG